MFAVVRPAVEPVGFVASVGSVGLLPSVVSTESGTLSWSLSVVMSWFSNLGEPKAAVPVSVLIVCVFSGAGALLAGAAPLLEGVVAATWPAARIAIPLGALAVPPVPTGRLSPVSGV